MLMLFFAKSTETAIKKILQIDREVFVFHINVKTTVVFQLLLSVGKQQD